MITLTHPIAAAPIASVGLSTLVLSTLVVLGYGVLVLGAVWYAWRARCGKREVVLIVLSWVAKWLLTAPLAVIGAATAATIVGWCILFGTILGDAAFRRWAPDDAKGVVSFLKRRP
jgi:hypothetical protein